MKPEEYLKTQQTLISIGAALDSLDLAGFLKAIQNAQTLAPKLNPEMLQKAQLNLQALKGLATSCLPVKTTFQNYRALMIKTFSQKKPENTEVKETTVEETNHH